MKIKMKMSKLVTMKEVVSVERYEQKPHIFGCKSQEMKVETV